MPAEPQIQCVRTINSIKINDVLGEFLSGHYRDAINPFLCILLGVFEISGFDFDLLICTWFGDITICKHICYLVTDLPVS